jgi:hypothetical protein
VVRDARGLQRDLLDQETHSVGPGIQRLEGQVLLEPGHKARRQPLLASQHQRVLERLAQCDGAHLQTGYGQDLL